MNKFFLKYVNKVVICFEEVKLYFSGEKVVFMGNLRVFEVVLIKMGWLMVEFGFFEEKKMVLIFGGSWGVVLINCVVIDM